MPRKTSSQWDFGELFPPEQVRKVFTVSEITGRVRQLLEGELALVWVGGEISNLRIQSSGHVYFTLKDAGAQLNCVLFRHERVARRELLCDGLRIIAQGGITVYEPRGQHQLRVTGIEFQGVGALQAAFEQLKRKLQEEGLFDAARKRPLPAYPQCIGLVTSPTGAAIRDVLHVIQRRNPGLRLVLAPCRVQGEGASAEIARAIRLLNEFHLNQSTRPLSSQIDGRVDSQADAACMGLDVILVTRGGGSMEDLWAFNEEAVARAVAASEVPVVSAVGHEIDFTITDFVADLRAATPSAAAEILTEGVFSSRQFVADAPSRLFQLAHEQLRRMDRELAERRSAMARMHPRRRLDDAFQRVDDLNAQLSRMLRFQWRAGVARWEQARQRFLRVSPRHPVGQARERVSGLVARHAVAAQAQMKWARSRLEQAQSGLRLLSPDNILARGYSITTDAVTGRIITRPDQVTPGQALDTRVAGGHIQSKVEASDNAGS